MRKFEADTSPLRLIQLLCLAVYTILSIAALMFLRFVPTVQSTVLIVLLVILVIAVFFYLPLYFGNICVYVFNEGIQVHTGVWRTTRKTMRASTMQYLTVIITPLSRFTGLNFIIINALGGRILIPFLSRNDTEELRIHLCSMIGIR